MVLYVMSDLKVKVQSMDNVYINIFNIVEHLIT